QMHPIKYLSIFILCLYYATQTFAQKETGSINGKITDENRAPVPGALIKILNSSLSTTSDLNGNFYLKNIPFGKQTVQVSSVGMKSKFEEFNINKPNQSLNFTLQEDIQQMKTVSVLGRTETQEANRQAYNVTAIDAKKLHN